MRRKGTAFRRPASTSRPVPCTQARGGGLEDPWRPVGTVTDFLRAVGEELRRARRDAGFALRDLNQKSGLEFKASAVGGYERGERSISLDRFCRLAALYGIAPDQLLARVRERAAGPADTEVVIDLRGEAAGAGPAPSKETPTEAAPATHAR